MRKVTPRIQQMKNANKMVGRVLTSNLFSTLKGRLLYVQDEKCYFETIENPDFTRYNHCAGQIDYIPEHMVICMHFEEEE